MLYHYVAAQESGRVVEGEIDAITLEEAITHLASEQLKPITIKPLKTLRGGVRHLWGGIKLADKIFLTKYLSLMLRVGTDLLSAINILILDFDKPAMKNLLLEVRDNLIKGGAFYEVFGRYPRVFSVTFVNLVKAAEASGNLQATFETLSKTLAQEAEIRGKVRAALIYPVILLVLSVVIVIFITTFALPKIAETFLDGGIGEPPLFSRIVFTIGLFIADHIIILISVLFVVSIFGTYFFGFNRVGRKISNRIIGRLPVIRRVRKDLAIQRFASTLSSLMHAGLPIVDAINITADAVGHEEVRDALRRITKEGLAKGLTIGDAFKREPAFPRVVTNLVAVSERAGHLDEVLDTLSEFYASNINNSIKTMISFLEPVLLAGMGIIIGALALSIILPVYQLASQI